jgi:hypothetical protein
MSIGARKGFQRPNVLVIQKIWVRVGMTTKYEGFSAPVNDFFAKNGRVRECGRIIRDMCLFEVKEPSESKERTL